MKNDKNSIRITFVIYILILLSSQKSFAQDDNNNSSGDVQVSYQKFYDDLSSYGKWVTDDTYGNVWVPDVSADFRPYLTDGYWVLTDNGDTWVSDKPWGWAAFHYGRWTFSTYYGWIWIPGYDWSPAWVSWRTGDGNCGWAPMGPGIDAGMDNNCPENYWAFVGAQHLYDHNLPDYLLPEDNSVYVQQIPLNTDISTNAGCRYYFGPSRLFMERTLHHSAIVYHISRMNSAGAYCIKGGNLNVYGPAVNRASIKTAHPLQSFHATHALGRPEKYSAFSQHADFKNEISGNSSSPKTNDFWDNKNHSKNLAGNTGTSPGTKTGSFWDQKNNAKIGSGENQPETTKPGGVAEDKNRTRSVAKNEANSSEHPSHGNPGREGRPPTGNSSEALKTIRSANNASKAVKSASTADKAIKAANSADKAAKAVKVANTASKVVKGAKAIKTAKKIYNVVRLFK